MLTAHKRLVGKTASSLAESVRKVKEAAGCRSRGVRRPFGGCPVSRGTFQFHSFQGSFFSGNHQKPRGNSWFLKRTMVEKNGESTPRLLSGFKGKPAESLPKKEERTQHDAILWVCKLVGGARTDVSARFGCSCNQTFKVY